MTLVAYANCGCIIYRRLDKYERPWWRFMRPCSHHRILRGVDAFEGENPWPPDTTTITDIARFCHYGPSGGDGTMTFSERG